MAHGLVETLETRWVMAADPVISEFSASNVAVLKDVDGDYSDWIEIYNRGDETANLQGWHLTDSQDDPSRWTFPSVSVPAKGFLTVFASTKNRAVAGAELHTNFRLTSGGEYLALVRPDGVTRATEFAPSFPEQYPDVTYGFRMADVEQKWIDGSSAVQLLVPTNGNLGLTWTQPDFVPDGQWLTKVGGQPAVASLGYETAGGSGFATHFRTDVSSVMKNVNASVYVRIPFQVDDVAAVDDLLLRVKFDDGYMAYLNGSPIDTQNASFFSQYNSAALAARPNGEAVTWLDDDLAEFKAKLRNGTNVLAFHAMNASAADEDFLLSAELYTTKQQLATDRAGYFTTPTPKAINPPEFTLGPRISGATHAPIQPKAGESIRVTAKVEETLHPVGSVELIYRVMYQPEVSVKMTDDGQGGDAVAGDRIYSASIPAGATAGQMVRYAIRATDSTSQPARLPLIADKVGTDRSPEYFGTVLQDPAITTPLPTFQWFTDKEANARSRVGARASVYYLGEYYDNIYVRQRGAATNATAQKFNFSDDQPLFVSDLLGRVKEINLNGQGSDPSYLRQDMSFDTFRLVAHPSSETFLVPMRVNAKADRLATFIEQVDEDFLKRNRLDPEGALYKFVQRGNLDPVFADITTGIEKKTRLDEGLEDLQVVVKGLTQSTAAARARSVFDNFDVANVLNYMALRSLILDADDVRKNFYGYRDTNGTGQWSLIPWDKDWSFGIEGDGAPHLWHPFFADSTHAKSNANQWNRLYDAVNKDPVLSQMHLRRLRSLMDELLEPAENAANSVLDAEVAKRLAEYKSVLTTSMVNGSKAITTYLSQRRRSLYDTHSIDRKQQTPIKELVPEYVQNVQYFVPTDNNLGTTWTNVAAPANAPQWKTGQAGLGFGSAFATQVKTQVNPVDSCGTCTSLLMRIPFQVDDVNRLNGLTLRMKYDDAFVVYINGQEVARANVTGTPTFDKTATQHPNAAAVVFEDFNLSQRRDLLRNGQNMLAIHALNSSASSSDMLMSPVLLDGLLGDPNAAGIPHEQVGNPPVAFGGYDVSPASGNQDEEYIELRNPTMEAVDISGWRLRGSVQHDFRPGTVIPPQGSLFVSPSVPAFLKRTTGPKGGEGRFVQGNYRGHLSSRGNAVELLAADGTQMAQLTTPAASSPAQSFLRISEINYHPDTVGELTEFVELVNISSGPAAKTLDLAGVRLSGGANNQFVLPAGTTLGPGEYLVVATNPMATLAAYPGLSAARVLGPLTGGLDNGGETLTLDDALGSTIVQVRYGDGGLWPERADGAGATLEAVDAAATAYGDFSMHASWQASVDFGGSPGRGSSTPLGVLINEVSSNNPGQASGDAIELRNATLATIDLTGWYLSDSAGDLRKYAFPAGTTLAAGGLLVVNESQFKFAIDERGDDVWLVKGDPKTQKLLQFADDVHFGGMAIGESFGRVERLAPSRVEPLARPSLGAANGPFRIGPLVISEVMYRPAEPAAATLAIDPLLEPEDLEYLEIHNPTSAAVVLTGWQVTGGIHFDFPTGQSLPAGGSLVLTSFNPLGEGNGSRTRAFRNHYGINDQVLLLGGYQGQLSDSEDLVQLQRAATPVPADPSLAMLLLEDEVLYEDRAPWPLEANGGGASLTRQSSGLPGWEASSWRGASPSPGSFQALSGDLNGDSRVDVADVDLVCAGVRSGDSAWDLDRNGVVQAADAHFFVHTFFGSGPGDANLDGVFDSRDFVVVFQYGEYEDNVSGNTSWAEGDWTCDGDFTTVDLVVAFQGGAYVTAASPAAMPATSAVQNASGRSTLAVDLAVAALALESGAVDAGDEDDWGQA